MKHIDEMPRVQLETPEQKQKRIESLYLNGVITPQGPQGEVILDSLKNTKEIMQPIVYDGQTETHIAMNKTESPAQKAAAQKQMDDLTQAIATKQAEERGVKKNLQDETTAIAARVRDDEAASTQTDALRMSLAERRAKFHALQEIQTLTAKLASLNGFVSRTEMANEAKAKREMKALSHKVDVAKSEVA